MVLLIWHLVWPEWIPLYIRVHHVWYVHLVRSRVQHHESRVTRSLVTILLIIVALLLPLVSWVVIPSPNARIWPLMPLVVRLRMEAIFLLISVMRLSIKVVSIVNLVTLRSAPGVISIPC